MELANYTIPAYYNDNIDETDKSTARNKLYSLIDKGSFHEIDANYTSKNILQFTDYDEKLLSAENSSLEKEAVITGYATIGNIPFMIIMFEPKFMMGTMGTIVGEKITRLFEMASKKKFPVVSITASGGARMQEGIFSLMQMVKTAGAVYKHSRIGLLYVSIICDPTLGGVTASFASLADIIIAEEDARYGFTGKRIVEETTHEVLPSDFQSAQYAKEHGQVDLVIQYGSLRDMLLRILKIHNL